MDNHQHEPGAPQAVPHNRDAEEATLGCILINPSAIHELDLQAHEFYIHRHRWIWETFKALQSDGKPIDFLTASAHLEKNNQLGEIGGPAYLTALTNTVPSSLNVKEYAALVRDTHLRRQALEIASGIAQAAYTESNDIITERANSAKKLNDVISSDGAVPFYNWVSDTYDYILECQSEPRDVAGISTGLQDVDKVLGSGLMEGVILLGGAPGKGKSKLVQNIVTNIMKGEKPIPGAFYTPELSKIHFTLRVLSAEAKIKVSDMHKGQIPTERYSDLTDRIDGIAGWPLYVNDSRKFTTATLRADLVRLKYEAGIQWVALDYLELLRDRVPNIREKYERTEYIARELIIIANDLELPMIAVQKLNKSGWDKVASMHDFSGGSDVVYDVIAACVLCDHQPPNGDKPNDNIKTLVNVKPQRLIEGTLKACNLYVDDDYPIVKTAADDTGSAMYPRVK